MVAMYWKLSDLEIIGYADSRDATMLPAVVPPIFRPILERDVVLLPPYALQFDVVVGPTAVSMAEALQLQNRGQIHLFTGEPRKAIHGHQMWLRRDGQLIYEPVHEARRALDRLSEEAIQRAIGHLLKGELDSAEVAASEAILSNDRRVDALAIKAAIRRKSGNVAGERLMAELAASLMDSRAFDILVGHFAGSLPVDEPIPNGAKRRSRMEQIATVPARAA